MLENESACEYVNYVYIIHPLNNNVAGTPLFATLNKEMEISMDDIAISENEKSAKTFTTIIYALYAASFLVGITAIVGIVLNYVKKDDVAGTFLESHFRWQIRTFWFGLLWTVVGAITWIIIVGWFVLSANAIWIIYRIVKGWLRLNENKPMYAA